MATAMKTREKERRCAVTREVRPTAALLRFALAPDGVIVPDLKGVLPGRGVWLTLDRVIVDEAARKNPFAASLKRPVSVPADLGAMVEAMLYDAALNAVALAKKGGAAVAGFEKVASALERGDEGAPVALLLCAADAAEDGRRKLAMKAAHSARNGDGGIAQDMSFTGEALSHALGLGNAVHVAILDKPAARPLQNALQRLNIYRGVQHSSAPPLQFTA